MPRKYVIPALVMFAYAGLMLLAGIVAFLSAPETANPWTALIIPGVASFLIIVCGALTLQAQKSPRNGRVGAHLGFMLALVFTLLFSYTAFARTMAHQRHPAAMAEYRQALEAGAVTDTDADRRAFFRQRRAARHDIGYLVRTLWFVAGLSGVAFVVLIVVRPKPRELTQTPPS